MKRIIALLMLLVMICGIFAACQSGGTGSSGTEAPADKSKSTSTADSPGSTTLTLWYWQRSVDEDVIKNVSEAFPGVTIDNQIIADDYTAKIISTLAGGAELPDIICFNTNVSRYVQYTDKFENLLEEPYNADKIKDQYLEWKWNMALSADSSYLIALPMDTGPTAWMYRADLFEEAGLPSDPDEVSAQINSRETYLEAGEKLKAAGYYLTDEIAQDFLQTLCLNADLFWDRDGNFIGDRDEIKENWDFAIEILQKGYTGATDRRSVEWNALYTDNKAAALIDAVWMKQYVEEGLADTSGNWRVARSPLGDGNNGGSFIGITSDCSDKETAWEVIQWMMNADNQAYSLSSLNLFPARTDVLDREDIFVASDFWGGQKTDEVFAESALNIKPFYYGPYENDARTIFSEVLREVERTGKDPEEGWQEALDRVDAEIDR